MPGIMIFHHPEPILEEGMSGSQVRPFRMWQAFKELGYQIELVAGYARERRQAIQRVRQQVQMGQKVNLVYAESSTTPTLLTETHHIPTHPFVDFDFWAWLKKQDVPIGLFYRDVHWRFDQHRKNLTWYKRAVAIPFYWYDWIRYRQLVDHLFLPSLGMRSALPGKWEDERSSALPPGCALPETCTGKATYSPGSGLKLVYVGNVIPPLYDLRPLIKVVHALKDVSLTLCCPASAWEQMRAYYEPIGDRVQIVHASGKALDAHYANADLFAMVWGQSAYLDFAMPVKLFESLGHGVPVITIGQTQAAKLVSREKIGWVAANVQEVRQLLLHLKENPDIIMEKRKHVNVVRRRHTWLTRARRVVDTLARIGDRV